MRKIIILFILVSSIVISSGCGLKKQNKETGLAEGTESMPQIVYVYQCINYSDTYVNYGCYIENTGKLYTFDFSDKDRKYANSSQLLDYLKN